MVNQKKIAVGKSAAKKSSVAIKSAKLVANKSKSKGLRMKRMKRMKGAGKLLRKKNMDVKKPNLDLKTVKSKLLSVKTGMQPVNPLSAKLIEKREGQLKTNAKFKHATRFKPEKINMELKSAKANSKVEPLKTKSKAKVKLEKTKAELKSREKKNVKPKLILQEKTKKMSIKNVAEIEKSKFERSGLADKGKGIWEMRTREKINKASVSNLNKRLAETAEGKVLGNYSLEVDEVVGIVKIIKKGGQILYKLEIPHLTKPTLALLNEIRRDLITGLTITTAEIADPKIITNLKLRFRHKADSLLSERIPSISSETKKLLIGILLHEILGLKEMEFLLSDAYLEEIVINSSREAVRVYHKNYGWMESNVFVENEMQIQNYANIIARRVGRQITTLDPLLDAHLVTGDRANAVLYPISTKGNSLTIRKFARDPWTVVDLINNKTANSDLFALLWLAIQYEMNILMSGGTASGKTSLLNVCMLFIPLNHRIISIEQTRELQLPKFLYWCPLTVRQPNPEGKGEVSMLDLLVNSLRMRPDRIIVGEIRRKDEAEVLFEAMHTGHSVYATVHADNIDETLRRLVNPPINVPANLLSTVDLNVVMFRDRRRGIRRVYQIGEFVRSEETVFGVKPNILYRWRPDTDQIVKHGLSLRLFENLSRHTGLTQAEIEKDLIIKKKILDIMVKKRVRGIEAVGNVIKDYYLESSEYVLGRLLGGKYKSEGLK